MQIVAKPHSFARPEFLVIPEGKTIKQIVAKYNVDVIVQVNGEFVTKDQWGEVVPKNGDNIVITTKLEGGGRSKNFLRTILSIAVVVGASVFFGPSAAALETMGPWAKAAAHFKVGFIAAAGVALINALIPIRQPEFDTTRQSPTYSITGARNDARPFGTVPVVLGKHRMYPPQATGPYTEVLGNDEFLNMMVTWGYGPLVVSDLRIGNADLNFAPNTPTPGVTTGVFSDVSLETKNTDGELIQSFPATVFQDVVNLTLIADSDPEGPFEWTERRTAENIDAFSFDIVFPQGSGWIDNDGKVQPYTQSNPKVGPSACDVEYYNSFQYRYKKSSETTWGPIILVDVKDVTREVVRKGIKVEVERGQYDIQVSRVCRYNPGVRVLDTTVWSYLRSLRYEQPVNFRKPLVLTALRIKATDQLSGVIDTLNGMVESVSPVWDGTKWTSLLPTSNPAALFRWVLLGPGSDRPRTINQVDDESLGEWYEFCEENGYEFNQIRDSQESMWDVLSDIASAGRAAPTLVNGKWGVIIDHPDKPVVQHFTPRNSWNFSSNKVIPIQPHAFRIRFWNEERNYQVDERIVQDDGYRPGEANPTLFESIEFPGITNPDLIWKFGRYFIAQARLRPEEYTFSCDFEHLACQRGDVIRVSHDVTLWGSGFGRVKELKLDSNEDVVGVFVDEQFTTEPGKNYNMRFRLEDGTSLIVPVIAEPGVRTEFDFSSTQNDIKEGDLVMFGEVGRESQRLIVKRIERGQDLTARLVCVDEAPPLYEADTGDIPPFDSNTTEPVDITQSQPDAPTIINVESGTVALVPLGNGAFMPRILVTLQSRETIPAARNFQVRFRSGENNWTMVTTNPENMTVPLAPVQTGDIYEIQARAVSVFNVVGQWGPSRFEEVVGELEPPSDVTEFIAIQTKYGIRLSWSPVSDIDLRDYEIRVGNTWDTAQVLVNIDSTEWLWDLRGSGVYRLWIAARDYAGIYSENPTSYEIEVIGPSVINLTHHFDGPDVVLEWTRSESLFAVEDYEVESGGEIYTASMTTSFRLRVNWGGTRRIGVTPIDIAGNRGPTAFTDVVVVSPSIVRNLTVQVIDNNVLLNWIRPATHTLPIQNYEVFKGDTFDSAVSVGEVGGTFIPLFETQAGFFTYWIRAIDTADNIGAVTSITVQVNPPPDYVLRDVANIDFTQGTHDNTCAIDGRLYAPNDSCEQTWASHFEDEGWTTIQQQINAGYPLYLQPVPMGPASFTKEIDYGTVLPPTIITLSTNIDIMDGDVAYSPVISYRAEDTDPWTDMEPGATQVFVNTFRYIKIVLNFESESGRTGLARINELLLRLDVKLRTDSGHVEVNANPTTVTFGVPFIDIQSITLTPLGTTPRFAVYDFDDSPNPTGFDIYLFDADGGPTTGTVSWTARGV